MHTPYASYHTVSTGLMLIFQVSCLMHANFYLIIFFPSFRPFDWFLLVGKSSVVLTFLSLVCVFTETVVQVFLVSVDGSVRAR